MYVTLVFAFFHFINTNKILNLTKTLFYSNEGNFETGMKMNTIKKNILNKTDKKQNSPRAHTDEILCLALSDDFKFLVSE